MKKRCFLLILICLTLSFSAILNKALAVDGTTLYVDPVTVQDVPVGGAFKINVVVGDVQNLFTWQIKLLFNSTVLNCTTAVYPATGGIFQGKSIIPVTPTIDNSVGFVLYGASLMGADSASGSGILCEISFKVLAVGKSDLEFSSPYGGDTFLLDVELELIPATIQGGFFANIPVPLRDIAVTVLSLSNNRPKEGENVSISVTVLNNGSEAESFDISLSYDDNLIETQTVTSLAPGGTATLTFTWNTTGVPLGSHTIKAQASSVPGETNVVNNVKTATVTVLSPVALPTDINGDGVVDMKDVGAVARAFGESPGRPRWDPALDINGDGVIDLMDLALIARDFGKRSA